MSIENNLQKIISQIGETCALVAVTKNQPTEKITRLYTCGHRIFGENRVQDLLEKYEKFPKDIDWHLIGHLQTNKVKYIASFIQLIHSVDSIKVLAEINKHAEKNKRIIDCLLQIYIAQEETKFGLTFDEAHEILHSEALKTLKNIHIRGFMGMASNTNNTEQIRKEFRSLKSFFEANRVLSLPNVSIQVLSMGMSSDYLLALEEGSNMIRVGSALFSD